MQNTFRVLSLSENDEFYLLFVCLFCSGLYLVKAIFCCLSCFCCLIKVTWPLNFYQNILYPPPPHKSIGVAHLCNHIQFFYISSRDQTHVIKLVLQLYFYWMSKFPDSKQLFFTCIIQAVFFSPLVQRVQLTQLRLSVSTQLLVHSMICIFQLELQKK